MVREAGLKAPCWESKHGTPKSQAVSRLPIRFINISYSGSPQLKCVYVPLKDVSVMEGCGMDINPYPTAFPYGNGMVLHFYQQQESSTTKTVHKVINKGLKTYV